MIGLDIQRALDDSAAAVDPGRRMFKNHLGDPVPVEDTVVALANCKLHTRTPEMVAILRDPIYSARLKRLSTIIAHAMTTDENMLSDQGKRIRAAAKGRRMRPKHVGMP